MARTGMATLISLLRGYCNAGTADTTIGATTYWSDDQLQAELDRTQQTWRRVPLVSAPVVVSSVYEYYDYLVPDVVVGSLEEAATDSGWAVKDSAGATVGTANYSVNYAAKKITFSADQRGTIYYLDARSYNPTLAAAQVWRTKAGFAANNVDWQSDNHRVSGSQEAQRCLEMADYYEQQGGARVGRFVRSDEM